jgi:Zn-dependent peptidase ImmA (M78 family)
MSKDRRQEKISVSTYPATQLSFNEWCKALNVSSQFMNRKLYDMYNRTDGENNILSKFLKQKK